MSDENASEARFSSSLYEKQKSLHGFDICVPNSTLPAKEPLRATVSCGSCASAVPVFKRKRMLLTVCSATRPRCNAQDVTTCTEVCNVVVWLAIVAAKARSSAINQGEEVVILVDLQRRLVSFEAAILTHP